MTVQVLLRGEHITAEEQELVEEWKTPNIVLANNS